MYGLLKTIADYIGLVAAGFAVLLVVIQANASGETAKRTTLNATAVVLFVAFVAYYGSVIQFGPRQVAEEKAQAAQETRLEAYREPIRSATAQATLLVECEEAFEGTHFVGVRCGFGQGDTPTLAVLTNQFLAMPRDEKRSVLMFSAELDKSVSVLPSSVDALANSEYFLITIGNDKLPEGAILVEGEIVFTLNGSLHLEIALPSQEIHDNKMFLRDLGEVFSSFPSAQ